MAKRDVGTDAKLARLHAIERDAPDTAKDELATLLADDMPFVAARAAEVAERLELSELAEPLLATTRRVLDGQQRDSGCRVLTATLRALAKLEVEAGTEYLRAMKLVRRERSGVSFVDSAISVRLAAAEALATSRRASAVLDIVTLLGDDEADVRAGAAALLGMFRADSALAALYTKLVAGDESPDVLGACMTSLARADPSRFVPVVARALDSESDTIAELAAIALGESHADSALAELTRAITTGGRSRRNGTLLLAVSLLRSDAALDYLLDVLGKAPEPTALEALDALRIHRELPSLKQRVMDVVAKRRMKKLSEALRSHFDGA